MAHEFFCQGHYSIKKGMAFLGLGLDNLVNVKADSKGKMDVQDLEDKILQLQSEVEWGRIWYSNVFCDVAILRPHIPCHMFLARFWKLSLNRKICKSIVQVNENLMACNLILFHNQRHKIYNKIE